MNTALYIILALISIAFVIAFVILFTYTRRREKELENMRNTLEKRSEEINRQAILELRDISREMLRSSASDLTNANSRQLDALLSPLRDKIDSFTRAVSDSYMKDNATRKSLADQIDRLMALNHTIGEEARNLTDALKGNSKVQGDWGEMVLESLLENAGLQKNVNFLVQPSRDFSGNTLRNEEGRIMRPDVVVMLPDNHRIIIDSKVSLTAYTEYFRADSRDDRSRAGRRHLESVRKHIDELGSKQYHLILKDAMEHVLMFIPNEGAYLAAIQLDPDLWKYAYDRKVVIVSPTHIFSVMQIVTQLWRQENQSRNAVEIAKLGGLLYDKFTDFVASLDNIDRHLSNARAASDKARRQLTDGGSSLVRRAERLRNLGAKTSRRLSERIVDEAYLDSFPIPQDEHHISSESDIISTAGEPE